MASPLFNTFGNQPTNNLSNMNNILTRFNQFRQSFTGDPNQMIQQMVSSGRINQEQLNQATSMANQLIQMIKH